ncbi:MAG: Flagellar biosynthesis/type secretory pathway protein-like protein [Acidimicrobiaceae bacterium]|nr:Flagellar biosynthesis/type secretory pathway protein-like protein [Acidimicrobiaceae bacterium]
MSAPRAVLRDEVDLERVSPVRTEPLAEASDPFETARAEAAYAGYEHGMRLAKEQATRERTAERAAAAQALGAALTAFQKAASELQHAYASAAADLEPRVARLALDLVREILGHELDVVGRPGAAAIERALQLVPTDGAVVVRLNPGDATTLGDLLGSERELVVRPDPSVGRGGCILEAGSTFIDARVESAIERVRAVLLGATAMLGAASDEVADGEIVE